MYPGPNPASEGWALFSCIAYIHLSCGRGAWNWASIRPMSSFQHHTESKKTINDQTDPLSLKNVSFLAGYFQGTSRLDCHFWKCPVRANAICALLRIPLQCWKLELRIQTLGLMTRASLIVCCHCYEVSHINCANVCFSSFAGKNHIPLISLTGPVHKSPVVRSSSPKSQWHPYKSNVSEKRFQFPFIWWYNTVLILFFLLKKFSKQSNCQNMVCLLCKIMCKFIWYRSPVILTNTVTLSSTFSCICYQYRW